MDKSARSPGLIQRDREALQARHYARRTVTSYEQGLRRFLRFHALRHPREMGSAEVNAFLTHLAVEQRVSPSTQNQALAALLFLDRDLLERDLELNGVVRAVLQRLDGVESLVAGLLYGSGLRLMEALRLRAQDLDFNRRTLLPDRVAKQLRSHLQTVRTLHQQALADGWGRVTLPNALARKYPNAPVEWGWQWVFPQAGRWRQRTTGEQGRHHIDQARSRKRYAGQY